MWYQNIGCMFFRFVTKHACDGQTDGQSDRRNYDPQDRASIAASRGKNKPYRDRLFHLNLPTLKYRRLRGDMIELFKITHNTYDEAVSLDLSFYARASTRGNNYKLVNHCFRYDLRKQFFLHVL